MTNRSDVEHALDRYLVDGEEQVPDRVLDAALEEIEQTPQRRTSRGPWRSFQLAVVKPLLVAAAVLAIFVVARAYLVGGSLSNLGGGAPTAWQTPSPSALTRLTLDGGDAAPGSSIEVPAGWEVCCFGGAVVSGEGPESAGFGYWDVTDIIVYGDPCQWKDSTLSEPDGADAIAAALSAQMGREGSDPTEVSVAGRRALHVRLTVPPHLDTTAQADGDRNFVNCDDHEYRTWTRVDSPNSGARSQQGPGQIDDLYIVDVADRTVLFDLSFFAATPQADRIALTAVLASVRLE